MTPPKKFRRSCWSAREVSILREHYVTNGPNWDGWERLLPGRKYDSIASKASRLGLNYEPHATAVKFVKLKVRTCGDCEHFRKVEGDKGRCAERHAVGMFGGAPEVYAHFDAKLCEHKRGRTVRVESSDAS